MRLRPLRWSLVASTFSFLACVACASSEPDEPCTVTAPTECPSPAVTYADVAPIFSTSCATCHTGKGKDPWSLSDYDSVADWQELVRAEVLNCTMPPKGSGVHVSNEDRQKLLAWVRCGALK